MTEFIAFTCGLVVMDVLWAWHTGLLAEIWDRLKQRFSKNS